MAMKTEPKQMIDLEIQTVGQNQENEKRMARREARTICGGGRETQVRTNQGQDRQVDTGENHEGTKKAGQRGTGSKRQEKQAET